MKDESEVSQDIQIQGPHHQCILLRNNCGACLDDTGRVVRFGLGNISKKHSDVIKSSDLIGITKVVITQEMVGQTLGVFTACEVKKEAWKPDKKFDKRETAQLNFINWVKLHGGYGGFAHDLDSFKNILQH